MDQSYDAIILGTGLKECILSGLLSCSGMKVLHLDRNNFYGGASASLNLQQLFEQYRAGAAAPDSLGPARDYNVDLIPKFIMANGLLVKMLLKTGVHKYMDFLSVDGSYILKGKTVHKVPASETEALKSSLLGLLEKRRFQKFLEYVSNWDPENPATHKGFDLKTVPMNAIYHKFKLCENTIELTGHAMALHTNDEYRTQPAEQTIIKLRLYIESLLKYQKSPYIYPMFGLGELPQAFARLSAIYGGTYMLDVPIDEILVENGAFVGVRSGEQIVRAKLVVGDPSYFPDRVTKTGQVIRVACILSHPIHHTSGDSTQIIIPQNQLGRNSDVYIAEVSHAHNVAPPGKYIAVISTTVESADPVKEVEPAIKLLGEIDERFVMVSDTFRPNDDGMASKIFISESYDPQSHFEYTCVDVMNMYHRITGQEVDLTPPPSQDE